MAKEQKEQPGDLATLLRIEEALKIEDPLHSQLALWAILCDVAERQQDSDPEIDAIIQENKSDLYMTE